LISVTKYCLGSPGECSSDADNFLSQTAVTAMIYHLVTSTVNTIILWVDLIVKHYFCCIFTTLPFEEGLI